MRAKWNFSSAIVTVLVFFLGFSFDSYAQCNMSQGCDPLDNLTYKPNEATGQVYHGDGATNNGSGGWTLNYSNVNQCGSCHGDMGGYLMTGHKNTMRKLAPGTSPLVLWGGPDGAVYPATDSHYGSGSTYSWTNAQVTLGWCDPIAVPLLNGFSPTDPSCQFPNYTLANPNAPTSYTTVAPTVAAGGVQNMYYMFGGWMNYGGASNPANTQLGTIFNGGFTGQQYPKGNFDCARCHTTGYSFDAWQPEPSLIGSSGPNGVIPNAQFSRVPSDGYVAPGTTGTSSWAGTGVQCERCHAAAWTYGSHGYGPLAATEPQNEAATALCMECHRSETVTTANNNTSPATPGSITPSATPIILDNGYCSDLSGSAYSTCIGNAGNTWIYKPYINHEAGPAFLNSPHARFSGNLTQNSQNSADLSVTISGTYTSIFSENPADVTKNSGCTQCHDPHQSTVAAAKASNPIVAKCNDCHSLSANILQTMNHPFGPGTPFPTGTSADLPGSCVICHMVGANGTAGSHLFRINTNADYATFPTPGQFYSQNMTAPNTASDGVLANAIWNDIDLTCGQCHVGGTGNGNPYGLTTPPASSGANPMTKYELSQLAISIHPSDAPAAIPTVTPTPGTYYTAQSVTLADTTPGVTIYYTTNGAIPNNGSTVYSGAAIPVSANTTIYAMALGQGYGPSGTGGGTYTLLTTVPTLSPAPGTYTTSQSVTLADATPGATIYYTTNGSTPTTASTPYTGPIPLSTQTTIQAIAVGAYGTSRIASGTYTFNLASAAQPAFSPGPYTYTTPQSVTLTDTTPGVTIYYTTNGTTPTTSSTPYTGPIAVSTNTTINAFAAGPGYQSSAVSRGTYTIIAATPTFSPGAFGTFNTPTLVTLSDNSPGVTIYYTTDGTTPTTASTQYTGPFTVSTTTTIKAIAAGLGYGAGSVASGTYTIVAYAPTYSPAPYTFNTPTAVTLTDRSPGVTIYYTTDGTTPTTASTQYTGPFTVSTTETVKTIAVGGGYGASTVGSGTYTIIAATPTFSPLALGTFVGPQLVTLADTTPGITIYYTTDGTTPTTASPQYSGSFTISTTTTVKAIAAGGGYGASAVGSGTYTITAAPQLAMATRPVTIYSTTDSSTPTTASTQNTGPSTAEAFAAGVEYGVSMVASGSNNITPATPTFSPAASGSFTTPQSVMIADASPGVMLYYTTNGSTPTTGSPQYTGPFTVSTTTTVRAIAAGGGYGVSTIASGTYNITAATPTFSSAPFGTFTTPQSVALADDSPGATIYYTTNGSTPTTASTQYTGPFTVSTTTTIKSIAVGGGYGASAVASGTYTITTQ
jgi:myo-inositol-hexaphosphate 3-phosphohydrolase